MMDCYFLSYSSYSKHFIKISPHVEKTHKTVVVVGLRWVLRRIRLIVTRCSAHTFSVKYCQPEFKKVKNQTHFLPIFCITHHYPRTPITWYSVQTHMLLLRLLERLGWMMIAIALTRCHSLGEVWTLFREGWLDCQQSERPISLPGKDGKYLHRQP